MNIIEKRRQEGKTTELVTLMLEPGNEDVVYVAPTTQQARDVAYPIARRVAAERGMTPPSLQRFIAVRDLRAARRAKTTRFVIDEMDMVLHEVFGAEVLAGALTSDRMCETAAEWFARQEARS